MVVTTPQLQGKVWKKHPPWTLMPSSEEIKEGREEMCPLPLTGPLLGPWSPQVLCSRASLSSSPAVQAYLVLQPRPHTPLSILITSWPWSKPPGPLDRMTALGSSPLTSQFTQSPLPQSYQIGLLCPLNK